MKFKELQKLPKAEIEKQLAELRKELMKSNAQIALGAALKNPGKVRAVKKGIAKMNAILSVKEAK